MNITDFKDVLKTDDKLRIVQEIVPGKQITLAHIIASPDAVLYQKLGLDPNMDYSSSAIGIVTMTPSETAIIAGDIAIKSSNVDLSFVDRFSGTLVVTGKISDVDFALTEIIDYTKNKLFFTVCDITKT